ncbi:hypothetical protein EDB19DRAFT_1833326 [Suillus lakei]|nr:hypothetical protein EDB19DRAFT_1833326 [Suillus lakei]
MPPRKGKKKADANDPIPSVVPTDELAAKIQCLDVALAKARIGIGKINILKLENRLTFGVYNDRPEKTTEINKMLTSFESHGIQAFTEVNALPIIIHRSRLSPDQTFDANWNQPETLINVRITDAEEIVLASGQHRVAALKKMYQSYLDEFITYSQHLKQLEDLATHTDMHFEDHAAIQDRMVKVKGHIDHDGEWGVILYDEAQQKHDIQQHIAKDVHPLCAHQELYLDALAHVWCGWNPSAHLELNLDALKSVSETVEEVLVSTLRNLLDEYQRGGEEAMMKALELEFSKPAKEKNSKITRVLKNTRLVMTLVKDVLPMGPHYRYRHEFSVNWLYKAISVTMGMYAIYMSTNVEVFRRLASKDTFPKYKKMVKLVKASTQDDDVGWAALERVTALRDSIMDSTPGDPTIFVPHIEDIDEVASKTFVLYKGTLGTGDTNYQHTLTHYRDDVHTVLYNAWFIHSASLKEALPWLEYLLHSIIRDPTEHGLGLPNPTKEKLSIHDFAKLIVDMSRTTSPIPVAAPLLSTGSAPMVFQVAVWYMSKFVPRHSNEAANMFLQNAFIIAANHLHINNIPWHHLSAGRGRRHLSQLLSGKHLAPQTINSAAEASQRAQASDSRAAWSACSVSLQSLPDFLSRTVPPEEFSMDNIGLDKSEPKDSIVRKTYQWAFAEFDMAKPLHQLALLVGIYVSKLIPDLFHHPDDRPDHESYSTMFAFTRAVREMPWVANSGRKGCKTAAQFVAMVPVYILAIFDRSSPLQGHFDWAKSFPTPWNKKHSNKGIGPLLLIRLGLASARSGRIWKGGLFNTDWSVLTRDEVAKFHKKIMSTLSDRNFGPVQRRSDAVRSCQSSRTGHVFSYLHRQSRRSFDVFGEKCSTASANDADDEVEIEEMEAPAPRRRRIH